MDAIAPPISQKARIRWGTPAMNSDMLRREIGGPPARDGIKSAHVRGDSEGPSGAPTYPRDPESRPWRLPSLRSEVNTPPGRCKCSYNSPLTTSPRRDCQVAG